MKKVNYSGLKNTCCEFLHSTVERMFLSFLVLVLIALIIGGFFFYQYSFLTERAELEILQKPTQLKESLYQKILADWQNREVELEGAVTKEYPDPFK